MGKKSCFFIGHREAGEETFSALKAAVLQCAGEEGVEEFIVGRRGNFDRLAARAVMEVKEEWPQIRLTLLLPYYPRGVVQLPPGFDGSCFPPGQENVPGKAAILRANRYAASHADCLIAWAWHPASNARDLVEYAGRLPHPPRIILLPFTASK